jgi:hypothetical protein
LTPQIKKLSTSLSTANIAVSWPHNQSKNCIFPLTKACCRNIVFPSCGIKWDKVVLLLPKVGKWGRQGNKLIRFIPDFSKTYCLFMQGSLKSSLGMKDV